VAQTLFIPLYFRAMESRRPGGLIHDRKAVEICAQVDYDFTKLRGRTFDQVSAILRLRELDALTKAFLAKQPDAVVVHIGCGLDTRFDRVDNGRVFWYDMDLAEVIALRRTLIPETSRSCYLGYSVLEPAWMDCLGRLEGKSLLLIAEGVFPFFSVEDLKRVVHGVADRFPGAELLFDTMSPLLVGIHNMKVALTGVGARVRWGLRQGRDLEAWHPGLQLLEDRSYFDQPNPRLGWTRVLHYVPPVARGVRILRYRLCDRPA
jgi:O-methyltransferase involved in polyketide biosynthesis